MHSEDCLAIIVQALKKGDVQKYGDRFHQVWIPRIVRSHLGSSASEQEIIRASAPFLDAAWELCRRGVFRPGLRTYRHNASTMSSAGLGFAITALGQKWLDEEEHSDLIPADPDRFSQLLAQFAERFGPGYEERSSDAVKCYFAHAFRGCCAMCGAAAESILLRIAVAKNGDEDKVLSMYRTASGRGRVESLVLGQADRRVQKTMRELNGLLKYWRDFTAHGAALGIDDAEASVALLTLVRYASFANEKLIRGPLACCGRTIQQIAGGVGRHWGGE
jgi:hypothetical protein